MTDNPIESPAPKLINSWADLLARDIQDHCENTPGRRMTVRFQSQVYDKLLELDREEKRRGR